MIVLELKVVKSVTQAVTKSRVELPFFRIQHICAKKGKCQEIT